MVNTVQVVSVDSRRQHVHRPSDGGSVPPASELEDRLLGWSVPSDVRAAVHRALDVVTREGATLIEATIGDQVGVAVRGQPVAVYISPSHLSAALDPVAAERAHRADSAIGLDKSSESTWIVHCRYGRLDSARLNAMTALMVTALRRYAPRPEPRRRRRNGVGPLGAQHRRRRRRSAGRARRTAGEPSTPRFRAVPCPAATCRWSVAPAGSTTELEPPKRDHRTPAGLAPAGAAA